MYNKSADNLAEQNRKVVLRHIIWLSFNHYLVCDYFHLCEFKITTKLTPSGVENWIAQLRRRNSGRASFMYIILYLSEASQSLKSVFDAIHQNLFICSIWHLSSSDVTSLSMEYLGLKSLSNPISMSMLQDCLWKPGNDLLCHMGSVASYQTGAGLERLERSVEK